MTTDYSRYQTLQIERDGGILTVTTNNPDQLNCATETDHREAVDTFLTKRKPNFRGK